MYFNRWIVFVACAFLQASAGLNYSFSVFAPALKELFHLDEVQLGTVATLGFNMGGYLAVVSGSVYDALGRKNHVGPRTVALIGSALLFAGYFGIYCLAQGLLPFSYPSLLLFALMAGNAGCWFDTTALATCIFNYNDDRGTVVGILKSFLGLTATIYTAIYVAAFQPDTVSFILFLALCPSALSVFLAIFINKVPREYHEEAWACVPGHAAGQGPGQGQGQQGQDWGQAGSGRRTPPAASRVSKHTRFAAVYCVVAVVALAGMATAIWSSQHELGGTARQVILTGLVVLLGLLLLVPISSGPYTHPRRRHRRRAAAAAVTGAGDETEPLLPGHASAPGAAAATRGPSAAHQPQQQGQQAKGMVEGLEGGSAAGGRTGLHAADTDPDPEGQGEETNGEEEGEEGETLPQRELTVWQVLQTLSFWIIVFQALMGVGTGLAFLNNITGIVVALGGNIGGQVVFVSLFSVANASGRLLFGYISERCLHSHGTRRTLFLLLISAMMTAFAACMCFAELPDLYAMALLGGVAFGGHWAVIPSVLADLFGLLHFASIYTMLQFAPAAGAYLLGTVLVGTLYEAAKAVDGGSASGWCIGWSCYGTTWMVLTGLNVLSLIGQRILWQTTSSAYDSMHSKQRPHS